MGNWKVPVKPPLAVMMLYGPPAVSAATGVMLMVLVPVTEAVLVTASLSTVAPLASKFKVAPLRVRAVVAKVAPCCKFVVPILPSTMEKTVPAPRLKVAPAVEVAVLPILTEPAAVVLTVKADPELVTLIAVLASEAALVSANVPAVTLVLPV